MRKRPRMEDDIPHTSSYFRSEGSRTPVNFPSFDFNQETRQNSNQNPGGCSNQGDPLFLAEASEKPWEPVTIGDNLRFKFVHDKVEEISDFGKFYVAGQAYVASLKSILNFDVIFRENWNSLEDFQEELQKWYQGNQPCIPLWNTMGLWKAYQRQRPEKIEDTLMVVVLYLEEFHRGTIMRKAIDYGDGFYQVEILDYGDVVYVHESQIYAMAKKFMNFPVQAVRCQLNLPDKYDFLFDEHFSHPNIRPEVLKKLMLEAGLVVFKHLIFNKKVDIEYRAKNLTTAETPWLVNITMQNDDDREPINVIKMVCEAMEKSFFDISNSACFSKEEEMEF